MLLDSAAEEDDYIGDVDFDHVSLMIVDEHGIHIYSFSGTLVSSAFDADKLAICCATLQRRDCHFGMILTGTCMPYGSSDRKWWMGKKSYVVFMMLLAKGR